MANIVQMPVDAFWQQLQDLELKLKDDQTVLDGDKLRLQRAYTAARNDTDTARGAQRMALLRPAIHQNSVDRIGHADVIRKYNAVVNAAAADLQKVGLQAPLLSGLGVAPFVVGAVVVGLLGIALAAWAINHDNILRHRDDNAALIAQSNAMGAAIASPLTTPAERQQLVNAMTANAAAAAKLATTPQGPPDPFGLKGALHELVPVLGLVAIIALAPGLLQAMNSRRAGA